MRGKSHVFLWSILFLLCFFSAALAENGNLLKNSSFDQLDSQGLPADWYTEAWYTSEGYTTYSVETEEDGGKIAMIHNIGENDARFAQQVQVEPNTVYRLSGRIRASDIPDAGWGANLSVAGLYSRTDGLYDTGDDWVDVSLYGQTGKDQTSVTVYARLGGYSGESKGYAWFTDLRLEKVDRVPSDVLVDLWFTLPASGMDDFSDDDEGDFAEDSVSSAAWPYLIALGVLYSLCLLAFAAASRQSGKDLPASGKKSLSWPVFLGLAGSLFLHLFLSGRISGYEVDINCFRSWGATMAAVGPARFYVSAGFCDYPPAYMLVLGLNQLILSGLKSLFGGVLPAWLPDTVILKLFPSLCDLFTAWLVYRWACENRMRPGQAGILCLLVAFHPLLILNSACWGQIDSVLMVLLLLVVRRALQKRWDWVFPLYILAVLVKPQALMVGPLGLIALIIALRQGDHLLRKRVFTGILVSLITAVAIILPFGIRQPPGWLLELYGKTLSSYAYASVNAANLYYLFGLNWVSVDRESSFPVCLVLILFSLAWAGMTILKGRKHPETPVRLPWLEPTLMGVFSLFFLICALARLSWSVCGYGAMALVFAILIPRFVRGKLQDLPFLCGLLLLLLYALGIKMHERYMFPTVGLLFLAWLIRQDRRILFLLAVLTPVLVVNEGIVLDNSIRLGAEYGHLNLDTEGLARFLSAVLLLASGFGLYIASGLELSPETRHRLQTLQNRLHLQNDPDLDPAAYTTSASLNWKRADTFLVLGITLAYSVLCFLNLGSTKAPQNPWMSTSTDESVILDLGQRHEDFSMLYYCQVSYNDFQVDVSDDLVHWTSYPAEMKEGLCFRWLYLKPTWTSDGQTVYVPASSYSSVQKLSGRYIRIRPDQIGLKLNEVLFRETETLQDADGQLRMVSGKTIPYNILEQTGAVKDSPLYSSAEALHDEQDTLEGEPGWFNGTYFDEIYHARTAYEHLHHQYPYETTHPPLGKVIMSWFIAIFGMTPFGWRFAGALAGILMLPVIYVFGKQLTGKTISGALPCGLLALDCMHLTQTRIATIDSFPVFFILCSYLFMFRFMRMDLVTEKKSRLYRELFLSGFFIGCAIASKWIGIYAAAGLAVLYFWSVTRQVLLAGKARERLLETLAEEERKRLEYRAEHTWSRVLRACLCCVGFFILIPAVIYLLSYIPYYSYRSFSSPGQYLNMVIQAQNSMFSYHSEPGLGMDHAFYSPWYDWPLNGRPMYYAMAEYMPPNISMSIFCFGNPMVWYPGLAGMVFTLILFLCRHVYRLRGTDGLLHWHSRSWDIAPAFLLISMMSQYLPWVLVPRGTYIYHYFATVPFLILSVAILQDFVQKTSRSAGRILACLLLSAAVACMVIFYPYASGMPVSYSWLDIGSRFLRVYYARTY